MQRQPILFVDVETTGFQVADRIVSLGLIELQSMPVRDGDEMAMRYGHFIFDPKRRSHPRAEAVHGYSDWALRHQQTFAEAASDFLPLFDSAGLIVGHNIDFDLRFVGNEFALIGASLGGKLADCTMEAYRIAYPGRRASLDAALRHVGVKRSGKKHSALEDAWMAMMLYLWLHGRPLPSIEYMPRDNPKNWIEPPPLPDGPLPRRKKRKGLLAA